MRVILVSDIVNPDTGKSYRQENLEKVHALPIGSLVEIKDTGVRLFVVSHCRDCDGTPLYSLSHDKDDTRQMLPHFANDTWVTGYSEDSLRPINKGVR